MVYVQNIGNRYNRIKILKLYKLERKGIHCENWKIGDRIGRKWRIRDGMFGFEGKCNGFNHGTSDSIAYITEKYVF